MSDIIVEQNTKQMEIKQHFAPESIHQVHPMQSEWHSHHPTFKEITFSKSIFAIVNTNQLKIDKWYS